MFERIQRIRRELHQIPELELSLPMTKAYLISQLQDLPCQLDFPLAPAAAKDHGVPVADRARSAAVPHQDHGLQMIVVLSLGICLTHGVRQPGAAPIDL